MFKKERNTSRDNERRDLGRWCHSSASMGLKGDAQCFAPICWGFCLKYFLRHLKISLLNSYLNFFLYFLPFPLYFFSAQICSLDPSRTPVSLSLRGSHLNDPFSQSWLLSEAQLPFKGWRGEGTTCVCILGSGSDVLSKYYFLSSLHHKPTRQGPCLYMCHGEQRVLLALGKYGTLCCKVLITGRC